MSMLSDRFGRHFPYLRLSLIEACNFHCSYCLPEGYKAGARGGGWLSQAEIARLLRGFARFGLRKLRLTGGEPTLRKDISDIIALAAATPGIEKIAMTSNGILVQRRLQQWLDAGLTHLNISVDSLDRERFRAITGHDLFDEIMSGVDMALHSPLRALKLNAVLLRGLNDDCLPQWLSFIRERPIGVRFIELMQTGDNLDYFRRHHQRASDIEQQLLEAGWCLLPRAADAGPAREYHHPEYAGRIGIIAPYSRDFCSGCNRLRVTARGDLRLCLFGEFGIPLRPLLQDDAQIDALCARLAGQLQLKSAGHRLHEGETGLTPHLASIGG